MFTDSCQCLAGLLGAGNSLALLCVDSGWAQAVGDWAVIKMRSTPEAPRASAASPTNFLARKCQVRSGALLIQ